jgi:hypothetical protein
MAQPITQQELKEALAELGAIVRDAGKVIDIAIYGGSCLMLASNFRVATADVDAVALADQGFVDHAAQIVAQRHGWPPDWLNDGVRTYLSPLAETPEHHELLRGYPDEAKPGVRVFVPTAEYLLAMKLMAMRIDSASGQKDIADILNLLNVVGVKTKDDIITFAAAFYPEARTSGRLRLAIDQLWKSYETHTAQRDPSEPPRYLGRSRAPR